MRIEGWFSQRRRASSTDGPVDHIFRTLKIVRVQFIREKWTEYVKYVLFASFDRKNNEQRGTKV